MKKTLAVVIALAAMVCITMCLGACGSGSDATDSGDGAAAGDGGAAEKPYEVGGIGLDGLVSFDIPDGYEEKFVSQNGPKGEIIEQTWYNDDSDISLSMLTYKEKGIMGTDGTLENYIGNEDYEDVVRLDGGKSEAYVSIVDGGAEDGSNIKDNVIEAVFAYGDYILSLDLSNTKEKSITKDQKDTFYKVLKSAGFTEFAE